MTSLVKTCLLAAWFLSAAGYVHATEFKDLAPGSRLSDNRLTLGPNTYILPSGEWSVAAHSGSQVRSSNRSDPGPKTGQVVLVSMHGNRVRAVFMLTGTLDSAFNVESWSAQPCAVKDVWFKDEKDSTLKHPDCLWTRPMKGRLASTMEGVLGEAAKHMESRSLAQPEGYIVVQYSKYKWGDFLRGFLLIDPAVFGYTLDEVTRMKDAPENVRAWAFNTALNLRKAVNRDSRVVTLPDFAEGRAENGLKK